MLTRCKNAECKAQRADIGGGVLRERAASPSPPARGSGERCKLPSGVRGKTPEKFEFGAFWDLKIASKQCNGIKYGN